MASIPDSRLRGLSSAAVLRVLTRMVSGIQPEGVVATLNPKEAKAARGKDKTKAAEAENPTEQQNPEIHRLQEAASELLAYLAEFLPEAAEAVRTWGRRRLLEVLVEHLTRRLLFAALL